jgi:hypothetical protein
MGCISIPAAIIAGSVASAGIGAVASSGAAGTQADAANQATATQLGMFQQGQANVAPWLQAGQGSLAQLQRALGLTGGAGPGGPGMPGNVGGQPSWRPTGTQQIGGTPQPGVGGIPMSAGGADLTSILRNTPGYQWQVGQGQDAILNRASSLGGVNSGATLKALSDYTSNQADSTYQQYLQSLFNLSGTGVNAGLGIAGIGAGVGQSIGGNIIGAGNAQAAGQIGTANAISGGLGSIYNQYLMSQALQGGGVPSYLNTATLDPSVFSGG